MEELRGLRHFLLGQSMGGAVALKVHLKQPREWDGVVLVAPMCKVSLLIPLTAILSLAIYFLLCFSYSCINLNSISQFFVCLLVIVFHL